MYFDNFVDLDIEGKLDSFDSIITQPNIVKINFFKGKVPDLLPLTQLPNLAALWFADQSKPSSFEPLKEIPSLVSLRLHNQFELLSKIKLPLVHLSIDGTGVKDFSWLSSNENLKWLSAAYNWNIIDDAATLPDLPKLQILELLSRKLTTLKNMNLPKSLQSLCIASNKKLKNLDGIEDCRELRQLDIFKTSIVEIKNIKSNELTHLTASFTKIKTIKGFNAPKLLHANFSNTSLKNLDGFSDFRNLERLNLNATKIKDLSPLKELKQLRHLSLSKCSNIQEFSTLINNDKLESLNLSNTSISFKQAESLLEIPTLKRINLSYTDASSLKSSKKWIVNNNIWTDKTTYSVHRAVDYLGLSNANQYYPLAILKKIAWM